MLSIAEVFNAFCDLGRTEKEIVCSLRELEITGLKGMANSCPLAVYINKRLGITCAVCGTYFAYDNSEISELPRACAGFTNSFDDGCYPELETNE